METRVFWNDGVWYEMIDGVIRREHQKGKGRWRHWHANGVLAAERSGEQDPINRTWYDNGQLASEVSFKHGFVHGTVRQWDRSGKLLGGSQKTVGVGVDRTWQEDGFRESEIENITQFGPKVTLWDRENQDHKLSLEWSTRLRKEVHRASGAGRES